MATPMGTLIAKIHSQPSADVTTPPSETPTALPIALSAPQTASARPRRVRDHRDRHLERLSLILWTPAAGSARPTAR